MLSRYMIIFMLWIPEITCLVGCVYTRAYGTHVKYWPIDLIFSGIQSIMYLLANCVWSVASCNQDLP